MDESVGLVDDSFESTDIDDDSFESTEIGEFQQDMEEFLQEQ
jgi:hypothetical protein